MSSVKNLIYHGKKPPTKEDAVLAKSHLNRTIALEKQKVAEHKTQKAKAKKFGNKASVGYNQSHIDEHGKDIAKRQQSKSTINKIWDKLESLRSKK